MVPTLNNPSYDINISLGLIFTLFLYQEIHRRNFKLEGVNVTGSRYILIRFFCLVIEVDFDSDEVVSLPVDPATWVRFPAVAG